MKLHRCNLVTTLIKGIFESQHQFVFTQTFDAGMVYPILPAVGNGLLHVDIMDNQIAIFDKPVTETDLFHIDG